MSFDINDLARLYPLETLRPETREQIAGEAALSEYLKGEVLFRTGDIDSDTLYLLEGEVSGEYPARSCCRNIPIKPPCKAYASNPSLVRMNAAAELRSPVLQ